MEFQALLVIYGQTDFTHAHIHTQTHTTTDIYTPLLTLASELIVLTLAFIHIWIEVSVAVKRMYVNNSNCDS